jgi:IS6 family transposase
MRGLQSLSTAKAALKGVGTFRAIRRAHLGTCPPGVLNEIRFVKSLFENGDQAA